MCIAIGGRMVDCSLAAMVLQLGGWGSCWLFLVEMKTPSPPAALGRALLRRGQRLCLFTGWGVPEQNRGPSMRILVRASARKRNPGEGGREQGTLWALPNLVPLEWQLAGVPAKGPGSVKTRRAASGKGSWE